MVADLRRFFGVSLYRMYAGWESVREVADMAANLPRGSAVYEWLGGWGAVSAEDEALRRVETLLQMQMVQASGKKQNVPEPKPPVAKRDAVKVAKSNRDAVASVKAAAAQGWR